MLRSQYFKTYGERQAPEVWETEVMEYEARLAFAFIERWGMVAGEPDGEDAAGRAKLKLSTPNSLVKRAFTIAKLAMQEAQKRELVHTVAERPHNAEKTGLFSKKVEASTPTSNF